MHNPESLLENETNKLLMFFKIKTDHPISSRQPDQVMIYKKKKEKKENRTYQLVDLAVLAEHKVKLNENEKKDK